MSEEKASAAAPAPERPHQSSPTLPLEPSLKRQLETLLRGTVDVHTREELEKKLRKSLESGRPLTVKAGFDPTAPDLHLGHTVLIQKMRQFQRMGHRVVFLIGDFTGRIGDPTGRQATRKALTREDVEANAETYKKQVYKILDPDYTVVDFNGRWLDPMPAADVIRLAARYNVARMMERDDFRRRYAAGESIAIHEFLYALFQAFDSVALHADVELGGHDQLLNLLVARDIQKAYGQAPQCVLTVPLMLGTDARMVDGELTGNKMSKSAGNYIGIDEPPAEIFGKTMSISDDLMWHYFELLSNRELSEIEAWKRDCTSGARNPRDVKLELAAEFTARFHGEDAAATARNGFIAQFQKGKLPDDIESFELQLEADESQCGLPKALKAAGLADSTSNAMRLIRQGAVSIDSERITDTRHNLTAGTYLIKVGKRRYKNLTVTPSA